MKYLFILVLFVIVSLRLSAQVETTEARQNTSGQVNSANSSKGAKVHGKTKAGEEGRITTGSGPDTTSSQTGRNSPSSGQTKKSGGTPTSKKHISPSKNANNKNGSKTSSSTTTSGSGKKDM